MSSDLTDKRNNCKSIDSDSNPDSAETPPQLREVGLCRAAKMSKITESHRQLRSQTAEKVQKSEQKSKKDTKGAEEERDLFVKLPKFTKRTRAKTSAQQNAAAKESTAKEQVMSNQRLCKYLKQPNCQRWIWCEFIESFIDKSILASAYDMNNYLLSGYPQLQTRQMPRRCWQNIRRTMGKARRFSTAFITGERIELERCRRILRSLQQHKLDMEKDGHYLELMPKLIPMPLPVDAKVISLLNSPSLNLCKGRVVGYEPKNSSYLVKFNLNGKQTVLSMPDCMLHTLQEHKSLPLTDLIREARKNCPQANASTDGPRALLDAVLQLQKLLAVKRKTVLDMAGMNKDLEASGNPMPARREAKLTPQREKMQRRYASNMITLHRVNGDILQPLRVAHNHLEKYEQDAVQRKCLPRSKLYEKCRSLAKMDIKAAVHQARVRLESTRELILRLQTLLYLCGELGYSNNLELDSILDDFLTNMLVGLPAQLTGKYTQIIGQLQPLRQHIVAKAKLESERCQQLLRIQNSDPVQHPVHEESDSEVCLGL